MNAFMPRVAAVIVTCNRLEKLKQTIERTLALPFVCVIIVDNASTDGTVEYLADLHDQRLSIIYEPDNHGGAGGFAHGFEAAVHQKNVDWLVCYDDDAYPDASALDAFAALKLNPEIAAVAAAVYFPNGDICPMNRPGKDVFLSPWQVAKAFKNKSSAIGVDYSTYKINSLEEVCFSSFVGLFVRCDLVRDILGLPRQELFIYRDDSIYTLSITRRGYKLVFAPMVRFIHDCKTPSKGRRVYTPLWKAYYIIRNDMIFFKEFSGSYFYLLIPILIMRSLQPAFLYSDPKKFLRVSFMALKNGLRGDCSKTHEEVVTLAS